MMKMRLFGRSLAIALLMISTSAGMFGKSRAVVFTDGEVDDIDSFIRLLLYSNDIDLEGLVYTSSEWHYAGDGKGTLFSSEMGGMAAAYGKRTDLRWTGTEWMDELIDKYALSWPSLKSNDSAYPSPEYLKSIVKVGNIKFEGEMDEDTEGSDYVKSLILDDDPDPLYMLIWGGTNTLARALKSIEEQYSSSEDWDKIKAEVCRKVIIYAVLDQDATYRKYISKSWPDIRIIYNSAQFWAFAYMWRAAVPPSLRPYLGGEWFRKNIKFGHGELMSNYYLWGDGSKVEGDPEQTQGNLDSLRSHNEMMAERLAGRGPVIPVMQYDFISEGDSPSYFFLLDFGLRSLEDYSYGGLGGRFVKSREIPARWEDGSDAADYNPETGKMDPSYPQTRWVGVLQNDFAARADWCVKSYADANHRPALKVNSIDVEAEPGSRVVLRYSADDPDDDKVDVNGWQYREAGTYDGEVSVSCRKGMAVILVPSDSKPGDKVHIVLQATDNGNPNLTTFQRIIVSVL